MKNLLSLVIAVCLVPAALAQHSRAKVSPEIAKKHAMARYHGVLVGKVRLENEDGKWEYSVNVRSGKKLREIMVDAHTGRIASVELTSPAEEAAEARAEARAAKHK